MFPLRPVHFKVMSPVHLFLLRAVHLFLIYPVHLKVIQGVHLIRCYQVTVRRTSIRFINQFKFDEFGDPTVYFNTQIFSTEGAMPYPIMRYGFRLTYDIEEGVYSIVNQNVEHLPEKFVYIFDIDVLNRNNLLYDVDSLAETMEALRSIKNTIFFKNVTEKTLETCN